MQSNKRLPCIVFLSLLLSACSSTTNVAQHTEDFVAGKHIEKKTCTAYAPVIPESVELTKASKLNKKYQVLGMLSINRYNLVGTKRQEANIEDIMKACAGKIGGNAVIHIRYSNKTATGTIVRFES
ncbi:MAG: hypothetical protein ABIH77_06150 [Pseudomonadota bacterium]|nr:hypothetical protein [Gammaproteobacteria bacterium]MBU1558461.1 hypothetical protein [Gammaproteobacteria bacterium]MBU1926357.1 hypothetical protein [Gammaproteobacteria bacterium]MBU2545675.1 hypothetical protein [Gammaproteobacteria bacterium]